MKHSLRILGTLLVVAALAAVASAKPPDASGFGQTQVLTNGEMVNDQLGPFAENVGAGVISSWSRFDLGATGGGITTYTDGGGDANQRNVLLWEDQDGIPTPFDSYPYAANSGYGMSVRFGGSSAPGDYGIKQTFNTTPGKIYFFSGTMNTENTIRNAGNQARALFNWGLEQGSNVNQGGGLATNAGTKGIGGNKSMGGRTFWQSVAATGTQMTARVGIRGTGVGADGGTFVKADGFRVWEFDVPTETSVQNGGFETAWNASNWKGMNPSSTNSDYNEYFVPNNWIPLGSGTGNVMNINNKQAGTGATPGHALMVDEFRALGRAYWLQKVNLDGDATSYTMEADVKAATNAANTAQAMIGIDPTGGVDPLAASVIWTSAVAADGVWHHIILQASGVTGAATMFLASGNTNTSVPDSTAQAFFDNITLTPEPTSLGLLALGGLMLARRRRVA